MRGRRWGGVFNAAAAGRWLFEQRRCRAAFVAIPATFGRRALADVYDAQAFLVSGLIESGWGPVAGYKIGLTTPRMQQMCRLDHPIAGSVMKRRVMRAPAAVKAADFGRLGVECEMALSLAKPLGPFSGQVDPAQVRDCLGQVCAAFELVDDRGADYATLDGHSLIADNSWQSAIVLGDPVPAAGLASLRDMTGELSIDGVPIESGSSNDVLGDPLNAFAWLAGHLAGRNRTILPGQWVMTGSIVRTKFAQPGQRFEYRLGSLPKVTLAVS